MPTLPNPTFPLLASRCTRCADVAEDTQHRTKNLAKCVALAFIALTPTLTGCFRPHLTHPIEIEVFDAISLEPVAGAEITHGAATGKFERSLRERATTDASGLAKMESIRMVNDAWWQLSRSDARDAQCGPLYEGVGLSQMPREFERVEITDTTVPLRHHTRYRAPLWPKIEFVFDLPNGFRGLLVWNAVAVDAAADSGWLPPIDMRPARFESDACFRASLRPNAAGVVAHPTTVGGVPGFEPHGWKTGFGTILRLNGAPVFQVEATDTLVTRRVVEAPVASPRVGAPSTKLNIEETPCDPSVVRAWQLRAWHAMGAPRSYAGMQERWPEIWFIGSLDELRAWLAANDLHGLDVGFGHRVDPNDAAAQRVYAAHKLRPLLPIAKAPSSAPMWSVVRTKHAHP